VCRRNFLRLMVCLICGVSSGGPVPELFGGLTAETVDECVAQVAERVAPVQFAALLPYVRRSVYVSGDAQPVYGDTVTNWTCTVTHVPETCAEFRCMLLQDVVPPLRFQWMTCVARAQSIE
jgi:hypothetical protein